MRLEEIKGADWLKDNQAPCLEVTVLLTDALAICGFGFNGCQMGGFLKVFGFFSHQRRHSEEEEAKWRRAFWDWFCEIQIQYPSLLIRFLEPKAS